ncbi:MAG: OB-fold domain-containing protein [Candidatus Jordarchaeales archaeon]|nr:OB-fold domain-containing protein [Candidatus Jordarchaeia archaeon]
MREVSYVKCKRCGQIQFPRARCVKCRFDGFEEFHPGWESGSLVSFTLLHALPERARGEAPYALGIAEFGGVRCFGRVRGKDLKVGVKVRAVIDVVGEVGGAPIRGLILVPEE